MGRGRSKAGGGIGGAGGGFTITAGPGGGVTITPNQPQGAQQMAGAGSGISDVATHTTYFTPADRAIVGPDNTDGYRVSPRTGQLVPVGYYQTGDYANINGELRDLANGKIKKLSAKTQKVVDAMDRNMRPLSADLDTVRWTDMRAIADNIGMPGASKQQVINAFSGGRSVTRPKADYTSSSWDPNANAVAGVAGRTVLIRNHYKKGALAQFSPTRKEGEVVGARNAPQRFANARAERVWAPNVRHGGRWVDALVIDCYIDQ